MEVNYIKTKPTVIDNVHESCYRCYSVLEKVMQMLERGDSKETIFEMVDVMQDHPSPPIETQK